MRTKEIAEHIRKNNLNPKAYFETCLNLALDSICPVQRLEIEGIFKRIESSACQQRETLLEGLFELYMGRDKKWIRDFAIIKILSLTGDLNLMHGMCSRHQCLLLEQVANHIAERARTEH